MTPNVRRAFWTLGICAVLSAPAAAQWSAGAPYPTPITRACGVWFAANGRFYAMGGRQTDVALSDYTLPGEYNPTSNSWTIKTGAFPDLQNNNMACAVLTESGVPYIYCVGGSAAGAAVSTPAVRRYDPIADVMTTIATDPWPAAANTLAGGHAVLNNKLYIIGGFNINVSMTSQIWEFDPNGAAGAKWTLKTSTLPTPVGYVPATTVGSLIYIVGGSTYNAGVLADSTATFSYDPVADLLTALTPTPRMVGETKAVNQGGDVWVLGGGRTAPNPSNQVDAYSVGGNSWSTAAPFALARRNFAVDIDPASGAIYMVGGYQTAAPTTSMEIYSACNSGTAYCTAGTTTNGCVPAISGSGTPSASAPSGFNINVNGVEGQKTGIIFYGVSGTQAVPWGVGSSSFLCVKSPTQRSLPQGSGGVVNTCTGSFTLDWNAYRAANPTALGQPFSAGNSVWAQGWFRDPPAPKTTNLSDGLAFTLCP